MMSKFSLKSAVFVLLPVFSGSLYAEPLPVVSSFSILGDVTRQIGGERVSVSNLVGPDQDAHAYQLTGADVKKIAAAKLVLLNGLGLEKADIVRAVKQNKVPYAEAAAGIAALKMSGGHHAHDGHDHDHDHGEFDPHVWQDPVLMQKYAANVATALMKADPAGKSYYRHRFNQYSAKLLELDGYARSQLGSVPRAQRKVLTPHDAFAYMGKRYGVTFIAPQAVSTEGEASAKTVAAIIRQIKQQGIKAVFTENIKNDRMIQRIAQETGVQVGCRLYTDALSLGAPANTYIDMYRYNVRAMSAAMKMTALCPPAKK